VGGELPKYEYIDARVCYEQSNIRRWMIKFDDLVSQYHKYIGSKSVDDTDDDFRTCETNLEESGIQIGVYPMQVVPTLSYTAVDWLCTEYLNIHCYIDHLTPWSRVLLQKLLIT
jgi:hypothetical protein